MDGLKTLVDSVVGTAGDLWHKGWAERNAGNMSVWIDPALLDGEGRTEGPWQEIGTRVEGVAGGHFLITASGSFMHNLDRAPDECLGVVEVDDAGAAWRKLWGFTSGCAPTSELYAHLRTHAARAHAGRGAIIHTHPQNLIALTYAMALDTTTLTRLLWEMHTECIVVFPEGCGYVKWLLPGSDELARASAEMLERRPMVLWQHHGAVAVGPDLETAFGLIDTAEKAAGIYFKAAVLGPVTHRLSTAQLKAVADRFGVHPDAEILAASPIA